MLGPIRRKRTSPSEWMGARERSRTRPGPLPPEAWGNRPKAALVKTARHPTGSERISYGNTGRGLKDRQHRSLDFANVVESAIDQSLRDPCGLQFARRRRRIVVSPSGIRDAGPIADIKASQLQDALEGLGSRSRCSRASGKNDCPHLAFVSWQGYASS